MSYIKIRFGRDLDQISSNMNKSIEDMFQSMRPMFSLSEQSWKPQMDIYETPDEIIILSEIAGVDKDDLELEISNKAIRVAGKRKALIQENATYRLAEIRYGRFERVLFLPAPIDTEKVSATYTNGLLQVSMAKTQRDDVQKICIRYE